MLSPFVDVPVAERNRIQCLPRKSILGIVNQRVELRSCPVSLQAPQPLVDVSLRSIPIGLDSPYDRVDPAEERKRIINDALVATSPMLRSPR